MKRSMFVKCILKPDSEGHFKNAMPNTSIFLLRESRSKWFSEKKNVILKLKMNLKNDL